MTLPSDVHSPRRLWNLKTVLLDGKDKIDANSLAIGYWDKTPRLASRWDRSASNTKGNPNSSGHPTWYILPEWMEDAILEVADIATEKKLEARDFLAGRNEDV